MKRDRKLLIVTVAVSLFISLTTPLSKAVTEISGTPCKYHGVTKSVGSTKYVCAMTQSKMAWKKIVQQKAASKKLGTFYSAKLSRPYTPTAPAGGTDDYRCFLIDPKIPEDALLTSIEFVPQSTEIIHHAILFRVGLENFAEANLKNDGGKGWPCFGGTDLSGGMSSFVTAPWLSAWAPGKGRDVIPAGYGVPIEKTSKIILQIHYNLMRIPQGKKIADQSGINLSVVPQKNSTLKPLRIDLLAAPVELACPAGVTGPLCDRNASIADLAKRTKDTSIRDNEILSLMCGLGTKPIANTTSRCDKRFRKPFTIISVVPHMHLLGRSLKLEKLSGGRGTPQTIYFNQNYNFDDQSATVLNEPIAVAIGDVIRVTCTFDPTLRQKLPELKDLPARYVTWGEGSSDEMCLAGMSGVDGI